MRSINLKKTPLFILQSSIHLDINMFYYVFLFGVFIVWQNFTDAMLPLRPRPSHRNGERLSRVPEFSVDLLSGPRPKPLLYTE